MDGRHERTRNHFHVSSSKTSAEYREEDGDPMVEPEGFSHLPAQHRRPEFNMVRAEFDL